MEKNNNIIIELLQHIAQLATDKKTLNGEIMDYNDVLAEIKTKAERGIYFIEKQTT